MLRWEPHIQPMIDACENVRDEAIIALAWDLGPRGGELCSLTVGDISEGDYGLRVRLEGKQGSRSPTIVRAVPYVRDWLERHPGGDPDDPLWSKLSSPDGISDTYVCKAMYQAAERTDAYIPSKPTPSPTRMRKSSASYLARQNVNQTFLEDHHGWVRGSRKASRYIATFSSESDKAIARAHGVKVEDVVECVRCEFLNAASRTTCRRCGQALSQPAAEDAEARDKRAKFQLAQMDSEAAVRFMQIVEQIDSPEIAEELADVFDRNREIDPNDIVAKELEGVEGVTAPHAVEYVAALFRRGDLSIDGVAAPIQHGSCVTSPRSLVDHQYTQVVDVRASRPSPNQCAGVFERRIDVVSTQRIPGRHVVDGVAVRDGAGGVGRAVDSVGVDGGDDRRSVEFERRTQDELLVRAAPSVIVAERDGRLAAREYDRRRFDRVASPVGFLGDGGVGLRGLAGFAANASGQEHRLVAAVGRYLASGS